MDVGTHRYAGLGYELNTILRHCCHGRRVNNFGIDACLHGLEHVASGQVDGGGFLKAQVDVGLGGGNQGVNHALHMAPRHVVSLQIVARDAAQSGFVRFYEAGHDDAGRHITDAHEEKLNERDVNARNFGGKPKEEGNKMKENGQQDDDGKSNAHHDNGVVKEKIIHG